MIEFTFPKFPGFFITATDTEVGKTVIAGAIAQILKEQGKQVGVMKPVASGCRKQREGLVSDDAEFLAMCADSRQPLTTINPVRYEIPAAPVVCEEYEQREFDWGAITASYESLRQSSDVVIVEGIGGVMVPLTAEMTVLDLARAFDMPVVVVARPGLGTLNHTLMTLACLRASGLAVAGVVINGYREYDASIAEQTGPRVIAGFGQTNILAVVPYDETCSVEDGVIGDTVLEALRDIEWHKLSQL